MEYHVKDFIKIGMSDSDAVRAVMAAAAADRERTIVFDGKDFFLSESVILPADTTVIVDNCTLKQMDHVFDTVFRGDNLTFDPQDPYGYAVEVRPLKNIRILGRGKAVIEGPERNRMTQDHPACDVGHEVMKLHMEMTGDYWGYNVTVEDVRDTSAEDPEDIRDAVTVKIGDKNPAWGGVTPLGDTFNISVNKVDSRSTHCALIAGSLCDSRISHITNRNPDCKAIECSSGEENLRSVIIEP